MNQTDIHNNDYKQPNKRLKQTSIFEYVVASPKNPSKHCVKKEGIKQLQCGQGDVAMLKMDIPNNETIQDNDNKSQNYSNSSDHSISHSDLISEDDSKSADSSLSIERISDEANQSKTVSEDSHESQWSDFDVDEVMKSVEDDEEMTNEVDNSEEQSPMNFNRIPNCSLPLLPLNHDSTRFILFKLPLVRGQTPQPFPDEYEDEWDSRFFVKMPCSPKNRIISLKIIDDKRISTMESKWESIENCLLGNPITNSNELAEAMKKYNPNLKNFNFEVLHHLFSETCDRERLAFFNEILPQLIKMALDLPKIVTKSVPLLKQHQNKTLFLSQQQIGCLLANAFFSTYPKRATEYKNYPEINFKSLLNLFDGDSMGLKMEKLKCIFNYFRRILKETPQGIVSFERRCLLQQEIPDWSESTTKLSQMQVLSDGLIEKEGVGMLQIDFANKYIGGGILDNGCVQEEIRFAICPELIVAELFTEKLLDNEVLIITGCEQFNNYSGYGRSFEWAGNHQDKTVIDEWGRRCTKVVAMDALYFHWTRKHTQYQIKIINRELNKAYCAFMERRQCQPQNKCAIATGNWGCGAFNGDPKLKAIIQLLAASQSERDLVYFTFHNATFKSKLEKFYKFLLKNNYTVGQLYKQLQSYGRFLDQDYSKHSKIDIFTFIQNSTL